MVGSFAAYYCFAYLSGSILPAILMGLCASGLLGFLLHRVCYNKFFDSPRQISLICTIGSGMFLRNLVQLAAGTESKPIPDVLGNGSITFAGLRVSSIQIFIFATVAVIVAALTLFLNKTRTGLSLKAVSMDKKAAALLGVDIRRATTLGNMIGCAVAGAAGVLLAVYYGSVTPMMGGSIGMKSFCCAVLGGMASIGGAAMGGLLIGVAENLGIMVLSAGFRDIVSFVFLILILLVKPEGLFVKKGR
jgi:branched-chain amino acid transport system permease protein